MTNAPPLKTELMALPSLAGLSQDGVEGLVQGGGVRSLPAGAVLFVEGDPPDNLYLVLEGRLRVTCATEDRATEVVVGVAERGALLGEMGLLGGRSRSASVRAATDCRLFAIPGDHLQTLITDAHPAAWFLLRAMRTQLVVRLRTVDERVDAVLEPPEPVELPTDRRRGIASLFQGSEAE